MNKNIVIIGVIIIIIAAALLLLSAQRPAEQPAPTTQPAQPGEQVGTTAPEIDTDADALDLVASDADSEFGTLISDAEALASQEVPGL